MSRKQKMHHIIDLVSVALFCYAIIVRLLLEITSFIQDDTVRSIIVLIVPVIFIKPRYISKLNNRIHQLFMLRRRFF